MTAPTAKEEAIEDDGNKSGSEISDSDDDEDAAMVFPDQLFMQRNSKAAKKKKAKNIESEAESDDDYDSDISLSSQEGEGAEKSRAKSPKQSTKKKQQRKKSPQKLPGNPERGKSPTNSRHKKSKNSHHQDDKQRKKHHHSGDGKSTSKSKNKSHKSRYGGTAMPRQKNNKNSSAEGTGTSSKFLDTLESLMNPREDRSKHSNNKHDSMSQSLRDLGSDDNGSSSTTRSKKSRRDPGKHSSGGSKKPNFHKSMPNNLDLDSAEMMDSSTRTRSRSQGRHRAEGSARGRRRPRQPDMNASMPNSLDYSSASDAGRDGSQSSTRSRSPRPSSDNSRKMKHDRSNHQRRRHDDLNASMPDRLDFDGDDSIRSHRGTSEPYESLLKTDNHLRKGRKQPDMNASMPSRLDFSEARHDGDRRHRSSHSRRKPASSSSSTRRQKANEMNASMSDSLIDDNRRKHGKREKSKADDSTAGSVDGSVLESDMSTQDSAHKGKRKSPKGQSIKKHEKPKKAAADEDDNTSGSVDGSTQQDVDSPLNPPKSKTDMEALLKAMSKSQADDFYFPEIGHFDWKKWRKSQNKPQRTKQSRRRGPTRVLSRGGRPKRHRSTEGRRPSDAAGPPIQRSRTFDETSARRLPSNPDDARPGGDYNDHRSRRHSKLDPLPAPQPMENELSSLNNVRVLVQGEEKLGFADFSASDPAKVETDQHAGFTDDFGAAGRKSNGNFEKIQKKLEVFTQPEAGTKFEKDSADGPERRPDDAKMVEANPFSDLLDDDDKNASLVTTKPPARQSRLLPMEKNVEDAKSEHMSGPLVRQDSAARELDKLATFMTTIDVLANQDAIHQEAQVEEADITQQACCVIL